MNKLTLILILLISFVFFTSCGKKSGQDQSSQREDTKKEETKQQEKTKSEIEDSLRQVQAEQNEKDAKIKMALEEQKILDNEKGQWAIEAEASSTYAGDKKNKQAGWHENQMTGKPDVERYGDDVKAWASSEADKGIEWVLLTYPKAVTAEEILVRQTYNPGAIIKIELIDENGKNHTVWEGNDKTKYAANEISWFSAKFDKTTYKTKRVKITMACNAVSGWNEIDAVQLIGE
jgi:hypothetical protein